MLNIFNQFKKTTIDLCPEVNGQLLQGGQPLSGMTIFRYLYYTHDFYDSAISDSNGRFHFERAVARSRKPNNPWALDHTVSQAIWIEQDGVKRRLWVVNSPGYTEHQLIKEKLKNLVCDVSKPEFQYEYYLTNAEICDYSIISCSEWNDYTEKYKK